MTQDLNIHFEGVGVIPQFDSTVKLVTGANSVAFFDFVGTDTWGECTRAEAEAYNDTPDDAYIAGMQGEIGGGEGETEFIWLNEMRLAQSVVTEEALHAACAICEDNEISTAGEAVANLQHEVIEAVTLALSDAGLVVRNDILTEDATEAPEEEAALDALMDQEEGVTLSLKYTKQPRAKIDELTNGILLNSWDADGFYCNAGLPAFSLDNEGTLHLFVFDYIDKWWGIDPRGLIALARFGDVKKISLRLNSGGGDVDAAATARALIAGSGVPVEVFMYGICASAATFIGLVPNARIVMDPMSWQMIHRAQWGAIGDALSLEARAKTLAKFDSQIFAAYGARLGKTADEVLAMVDASPDRELWFTADECLKMGLVDEVATSQMPQFKVAASTKFKNITPPERFTNSLSPITNSPKHMEDTSKGNGFMGLVAKYFPSVSKDPGDEQPLTPEAKAMAELKAQMDAKDAEIARLNAANEKAATEQAEAARLKAEAETAAQAKAKNAAPIATPSNAADVQEKDYYPTLNARVGNKIAAIFNTKVAR
jgi:ATP-dependent protease ClpP protease subunit